MNILIVDDHATNLKLLSAQLVAEGHAVRQAGNGVEALGVLNREAVDAVISDILMPEMDGYRLCHEVRQSERLRHLPFVFYTATYTSAADEKLCYDFGADMYLHKPASPAQMIEALRVAMAKPDRGAARDAPGERDVMKAYSQQLVKKLEEKNTELQRAVQARDLLLSNMSHELRTPLNAVIGFAEILLTRMPGPLNDEQDKQIGAIQSSAARLLSLVDNLLDLTHIESSKASLVLERIVCREVLENVVSGLRPMAEQKGLLLRLQAPREDIVVRSDRRALRQILLSFCLNAVHFTATGAVTVAVEQKRADRRDVVEFSVTDTGAGIRPDYRDKLFDAFARMDSTQREGLGMGLHLSRKLAHLVGGRIEFSSEPGRGSRFWLTLPAGEHPQ